MAVTDATSAMPDTPAGPDIPRTLVVTNDFPPRVGGVQQFVWNLVRELPADRVAVLAPNWPGWREHDAAQPFPVHRWPTTFLWPTGELGRRVRGLAAEHGAEVVLFGHGFPLPLLGPGLAWSGLPYVVVTHGAEVWQALVPGFAQPFRRAMAGASEVTAITRYTARRLRSAVPPSVPLTLLPPAVDPERFRPDVDGSRVRDGFDLQGARIVLCVSRLVPRKGQDTLIEAMPVVRELCPDAVLLLAGGGEYRQRLEQLAWAVAPPGSVVFADEVSDDELPAYYAACDLFAMPCRSRFGGLEVEGFGIVFLEASATGKAVVAGRSGGSDEAVEDGLTGLLVEGSEPKAVGLAISRLLEDPALRRRMGQAGRDRVERGFTWTNRAEQLADILRRAAR